MTPARVAVAAVLLLASTTPALAKDYGQLGEIFPIIEVDLLKAIAARLKGMSASGELGKIQDDLKERTIARVKRPAPVEGLSPALEARTSIYDPSIVFDHDVVNAAGQVVVKRGVRVNPLQFLPYREVLVFFDGDRPAEEKYVLERFGQRTDAKLIMTKGSPFDAMGRLHHRFYFDQGGMLSTKLGVRHTPTIVERAGDVLKLSEVPL